MPFDAVKPEDIFDTKVITFSAPETLNLAQYWFEKLNKHWDSHGIAGWYNMVYNLREGDRACLIIDPASMYDDEKIVDAIHAAVPYMHAWLGVREIGVWNDQHSFEEVHAFVKKALRTIKWFRKHA